MADDTEGRPQPDFDDENGIQMCRTDKGDVMYSSMLKTWYQDLMAVDEAKDDAQDGFYAKVRIQMALQATTRQLDDMTLEAESASPPRKKSKTEDVIMGDAMDIDENEGSRRRVSSLD